MRFPNRTGLECLINSKDHYNHEYRRELGKNGL